MATETVFNNQIVGSYPSEVTIKVTSPGTTSVAITVPRMSVIEGIKSLVILDSGDRVTGSDADVTWTGNVVTIADGGTYSLANTDTIYLTVYGQRKL